MPLEKAIGRVRPRTSLEAERRDCRLCARLGKAPCCRWIEKEEGWETSCSACYGIDDAIVVNLQTRKAWLLPFA